MTSWNVIACGTKVSIGNHKVEGVVTGISIRFQNLLYEVTWWDDVRKVSDWFCAEEIDSAVEEQRITIAIR